MSLLNDIRLITESSASKITNSDLYVKSDGIFFTYNRLDFTLDSNNFKFSDQFKYAKNAVDDIEDASEKMEEIKDDIEKIKIAKVKELQKLDVIFSNLIKSELVDFDNQVGKYLDQYK